MGYNMMWMEVPIYIGLVTLAVLCCMDDNPKEDPSTIVTDRLAAIIVVGIVTVLYAVGCSVYVWLLRIFN